jgi:hypothetical protein
VPREITIQRDFLLISNRRSVYHLDSDCSLAWFRHIYPYPPAADIRAVAETTAWALVPREYRVLVDLVF